MSRPLEAAVFDLDGVVTRTASVHRAAWRRLFDDFLLRRAARPGEDRRPFSDEDYRAHVDGRPRFEGIRAFLASRGISLPEGTPGDPPEAETMVALGQRKNALYLELLDRLGVQVDDAAVALVRSLRAAGVRVGVATSSRNASVLLRRAGLESLFEAQVDGVVGAELGLRGKPHPDAVLECLRRLGPIAPERAMLVEDAASGVEAGRAAGFGLVLGVDRGENWVRLREAGADWVVRSFAEVTVADLAQYLEAREHVRPNALREWPAIARELRGRRLAVFLDYDGTLTPIVERPELAVLDLGMRRTVIRVTSAWPTYVISGRGLDDVRALLGIDSLWMAGSHGFDLGPPRGESGRRQVAPQLEPEIHAAADALRRRTASISGVLVEDKRFSLAVHYRLVEDSAVPVIERAVDEVVARHPALRKTLGKKVFQVQPAMDWNKGKALLWLLDATDEREAFALYLGDDDTDEDAFAVLENRGLGIAVTELPRPTAARYALQNPFEVQVFLERLASLESEVPR